MRGNLLAENSLGRSVRAAFRRLDRTDLAAFLLVVFFVTMNIVWLVRERSQFGYAVDEARILPRTFQLSTDLRRYGLRGFWVNWTQDPVVAPFLSFLAAPIAWAFDSVVAVVAVVNAFLVVLLLSAYRLTRDLAGRVAGIVALVVLAAMPGVIWWSRVFEQIIPGAAMWLLTILLVTRSRQFRSVPLRVGAGLALGLALVTRAMLIGFLPVLVVALVIQNLALPRGQRARIAHVAQFAGVVAAVAVTWWWRAFSYVTEYFRVAGYGHPTYAVDTGGFSLGADRWIGELRLTIEVVGGREPAAGLSAIGTHGAAWSLFLLGLIGICCAAVTHRSGWNLGGLRRVVASPEWFLGTVAFLGFAVLVTSSQDFRGYSLINLPIAVVLAASTFRYRLARWVAAPLVLVLLSYLPFSMSPNASWMALVVESQHGLKPSDQLWEKHVEGLLDDVIAKNGNAADAPIVAITSDRQLYSGPMVRVLILRNSLAMQALDWQVPDGPDDCRYRETFDGVIVSDPVGALSVGLPHSDVAAIKASLRHCRYKPTERGVKLPDGGTDTLWWRVPD